MNTDERDEVIRRIAALRVRKLIYWRRKGGHQIPDDLIQSIICRRVWTFWGYMRLGDALIGEFGFDRDRAASMTATAIREGFEDGKLYRISGDGTAIASTTIASEGSGEHSEYCTPALGAS